MNYLEKALKVSCKGLKPSSLSVYRCMWRGFSERLARMGAEPGRESTAQLARALEGAGDYATQKRLHSLVHWVYTTLAQAGMPLSDHTQELERMYLADQRAHHEGLTLDDLARLESAALHEVKGWKGVRLAAMVSVLAHTGIRQQELLALRRSDVWWDTGGQAMLAIHRKSASRVLPLPASCALRLRQWLENYPADSLIPWLFVADTEGNPMDSSTVWRQLKRLCARELGPNAASQFGTGIIRASLAKALQQEGMSTEELSKFLGHRQEASTAELLERVSLRTEEAEPQY